MLHLLIPIAKSLPLLRDFFLSFLCLHLFFFSFFACHLKVVKDLKNNEHKGILKRPKVFSSKDFRYIFRQF